jgi:hypothetical protein
VNEETMEQREFEEKTAAIDEYAASKGLIDTPLGDQRPSIGRIVHYVTKHGQRVAAIMTEVSDGVMACVDLHVFPYRITGGEWNAGGNHASVIYDEQRTPFSWHWPERA